MGIRELLLVGGLECTSICTRRAAVGWALRSGLGFGVVEGLCTLGLSMEQSATQYHHTQGSLTPPSSYNVPMMPSTDKT